MREVQETRYLNRYKYTKQEAEERANDLIPYLAIYERSTRNTISYRLRVKIDIHTSRVTR
jgi:hypothetical protein